MGQDMHGYILIYDEHYEKWLKLTDDLFWWLNRSYDNNFAVFGGRGECKKEIKHNYLENIHELYDSELKDLHDDYMVSFVIGSDFINYEKEFGLNKFNESFKWLFELIKVNTKRFGSDKVRFLYYFT